MKLNADIVYDYLKDSLNVELKGRKCTGLHLERPLFYLGNGAPFEENQLYVVRGDKINASAHIKPGVVLVVVGPCLQLAFLANRCTILHAPSTTDVFTVFNQVQELFNRFDRFDLRIHEILHSTAKVSAIVAEAAELLQTPVLVLGPSFSVIASNQFDNHGDLDLPLLGTFLSNQKLAIQEREPMAMTILDKSLLCKNLYSNEEYLGSITLDYSGRHRRESDFPLINYVAEVIVAALRRLPVVQDSQTHQLRSVLADLVDCISINSSARSQLSRLQGSRRYVCVRVILSSNMSSLPHAYLCNRMESAFPGSMAFVHNDAVVGAIALPDGKDSDTAASDLQKQLAEFVKNVEAVVGISDPFYNLEDIRFFYDQASAALSAGQFCVQESPCYYFNDFALVKLVTNAFGDLPPEMHYSEGMKRLAEHDRKGSVSYLETLRVYLQNNLSITRTSQALFIHRSTLLDRISRIERELGVDLHNPDDRLRLEILLKGRQIFEQING